MLGFSLGGQITIRAAADNKAIIAVIAEDPSPAVLGDHPMPSGFSLRKLFNYPGLWLGDNLQSAASGVPARPGVLESIAKVAPRPILLVASGEGGSPDLIHTYFESAGEPKEIWRVSEAGHGWISINRPEEYGEKLCAFYQNHFIGEELIEYALLIKKRILFLLRIPWIAKNIRISIPIVQRSGFFIAQGGTPVHLPTRIIYFPDL